MNNSINEHTYPVSFECDTCNDVVIRLLVYPCCNCGLCTTCDLCRRAHDGRCVLCAHAGSTRYCIDCKESTCDVCSGKCAGECKGDLHPDCAHVCCGKDWCQDCFKRHSVCTLCPATLTCVPYWAAIRFDAKEYKEITASASRALTRTTQCYECKRHACTSHLVSINCVVCRGTFYFCTSHVGCGAGGTVSQDSFKCNPHSLKCRLCLVNQSSTARMVLHCEICTQTGVAKVCDVHLIRDVVSCTKLRFVPSHYNHGYILCHLHSKRCKTCKTYSVYDRPCHSCFMNVLVEVDLYAVRTLISEYLDVPLIVSKT